MWTYVDFNFSLGFFPVPLLRLAVTKSFYDDYDHTIWNFVFFLSLGPRFWHLLEKLFWPIWPCSGVAGSGLLDWS